MVVLRHGTHWEFGGVAPALSGRRQPPLFLAAARSLSAPRQDFERHSVPMASLGTGTSPWKAPVAQRIC